jgi:hypothetical protein
MAGFALAVCWQKDNKRQDGAASTAQRPNFADQPGQSAMEELSKNAAKLSD